MFILHEEAAEQLGDTTPGAFDALPALAAAPSATGMPRRRRRPGLGALAALIAVAALLLLAGCGGGDCDAACEQEFPPPLDCKARPELCI